MDLYKKRLAEIEAEIEDYKDCYPYQHYPHWLMRHRAKLKAIIDQLEEIKQ